MDKIKKTFISLKTLLIMALACILAYFATVLIRYFTFNNCKMAHNEKNKPSGGKVTGVFIGFDTNQFKKGSKVLYYKKGVMLIGLDNEPYYLNISPNHDLEKFDDIKMDLSKLQAVDFELDEAESTKKSLYVLPTWLSNEKRLNYLKLSSVRINSFAGIKMLPLKHLILDDLVIEDNKQVLNDLYEMKSLDYLVCDKIFTSQEIKSLKKNSRKLNVLSMDDYLKMIESRKIEMW